MNFLQRVCPIYAMTEIHQERKSHGEKKKGNQTQSSTTNTVGLKISAWFLQGLCEAWAGNSANKRGEPCLHVLWNSEEYVMHREGRWGPGSICPSTPLCLPKLVERNWSQRKVKVLTNPWDSKHNPLDFIYGKGRNLLQLTAPRCIVVLTSRGHFDLDQKLWWRAIMEKPGFSGPVPWTVLLCSPYPMGRL